MSTSGRKWSRRRASNGNDDAAAMTDIDSNSKRISALVDPQWLAAHRDDADVCLVEIAGLGQRRRVGVPGGPDVGAERYGRIPGALHLHYSDLLTHLRDCPTRSTIHRRPAHGRDPAHRELTLDSRRTRTHRVHEVGTSVQNRVSRKTVFWKVDIACVTWRAHASVVRSTCPLPLMPLPRRCSRRSAYALEKIIRNAP